MATTTPFDTTRTGAGTTYSTDSEDGRAVGGRKVVATSGPNASSLPNLPTSDSLRAPAGGLLRGVVDENGQLKSAGLTVGIKLDLEAEVHLTARVRGDIVIGLY